jgi:hypothetical protein
VLDYHQDDLNHHKVQLKYHQHLLNHHQYHRHQLDLQQLMMVVRITFFCNASGNKLLVWTPLPALGPVVSDEVVSFDESSSENNTRPAIFKSEKKEM